MAELDLLDGKVATRNTISLRTFSWDTTDPSIILSGQFFINTTDNEIKQNIGTTNAPILKRTYMNDPEFQMWSMTLG